MKIRGYRVDPLVYTQNTTEFYGSVGSRDWVAQQVGQGIDNCALPITGYRLKIPLRLYGLQSGLGKLGIFQQDT